MYPERATDDLTRQTIVSLNSASKMERPRSLFKEPDPNQPEKQSLKFEVNLVGAPPEVEQLVNNIKQVAEEFLYHWKTFPVVLPTSICMPNDDSRSKNFNLEDLFVMPSFDELDSIAVDSKGEPRKLSPKQLESIRENGEFTVRSRNFPGREHVWRVSRLLQAGRRRSRAALRRSTARAASLLAVRAKALLRSPQAPSVTAGGNTLLVGLVRLFDIVFGMPSLVAHDLDKKVNEERSRYLVAELICKREHCLYVEALCAWLRANASNGSRNGSRHRPAALPYRLETPASLHIDLRLCARALWRRAAPALHACVERAARGWLLHHRERLIGDLRAANVPDEELDVEIRAGVMREYVRRVSAAVKAHPLLASLPVGMPQLLLDQLHATVLMKRAVENVEIKVERNRKNLRERLQQKHPILSMIEPWMEEKIRAGVECGGGVSAWAAHEEALQLCTAHALHQHAYFLQRDLAFLREREPVLMKELRKVKTPTRAFQWPLRIWVSTNWIVTRTFQGHSEVIPTVLSTQVTSIVTPRSDPSQPIFHVQKEIIRTTTTRWPFWRWINYCHRTWCWSWNAMFLLGVVVPWWSALSLRALLCQKPFHSDYELSQVNGTLFPRKSSVTPTLSSRLSHLYRHISKSRTSFETKPDTGFIGKGLTRHVNRTWNYAFKGTLGTLAIIFVFPLACLLTSGLSLVAAATVFLWMPVVTLLLHIVMLICYDLDCPDPGKRNRYLIVGEAIVWNIILQGLIQPVVATVGAIVICPVLAFIILIFGALGYVCRRFYDWALFHAVAARARVPGGDSAWARRRSGPGLGSPAALRARPAQALAALAARTDLARVDAWEHAAVMSARRPLRDYSEFVAACFGPFSVQLAKSGPYLNVERECEAVSQLAREAAERRRRVLRPAAQPAPPIRARARLTRADLNVTIQAGSKLVALYYPEPGKNESSDFISQRNSGGGDGDAAAEEWWGARGLSPGDWNGLTQQLLVEIFSLDILTPLDEDDVWYPLETHSNLDLSMYIQMIRDASLDTCPDVVCGGTSTATGAGGAARGRIGANISLPPLDVSYFNPRPRNTATNQSTNRESSHSSRSCQWQWRYGARCVQWVRGLRATLSRLGSKGPLNVSRPNASPMPSLARLPVPLPIPHPATIAVIIYNRDTDNPIPLDSDIVVELLRDIEDTACDADFFKDTVHRFRGGGGGTTRDSAVTLDDTAASTTGDSTPDSCDAVTPDEDSEDPLPEGDGEGGASRGETLPCSAAAVPNDRASSYHWTLTSWAGANRRRKQSGSVRVDLASPEDVTLDSDSARVVFTAYGTSV